MQGSVLKQSRLVRGIAAAGAAALLAVPAVVGAQDPPPPYDLPGAAPGGEPEEKPTPSLRRRAVIAPVSGVVRWRPPGRTSRRLTRPVEAALGSTVDTRRGRVRVIVSSGGGRRWRAEFHAGRFRLEQSPPGRELVTTLELVGGSFKETCAQTANPDAMSARAARRRNRRVRRLWGDGRGRFRTRGRYSAATVRGTRWLVVDRCDDTLTRVARGEVEVEDFTVGRDQGASPEAGQDPAAAPAPQGAPRNVRLQEGGSYSAGPED